MAEKKCKEKNNENALVPCGARAFLDSVSTRQRISEDPDFGCGKGKNDEEERYHRKCSDVPPGGCFAGLLVGVKASCFIDIRRRGRDEEDRDIDPIGGFADRSVICVKENGDQREPKKDAAKLNAPKIIAIPKKEALRDGVEKHRPKEELHMLPSGFIDAGKRRDPYSFVK